MPLNYSPWGEAAQAGQQPIGSLNNVALGIAKMRYQQALQQQREAIALGQLAIRQQVGQAQIGHYNAQTGYEKARTDALGRTQGAQDALGTNLSQMYQDPRMQGIAQQVGRLTPGNEAYRFLMPQHVGQNQMAYQPLTGEPVAQGPTVLSAGQSSQMPGQDAVVNPRPYFAPAGSTPMDAQGQPLGPQTGFRPGETHLGNVLSAITKAFTEGTMTPPGTPGVTPSDFEMQSYKLLTNAMTAPLQAPKTNSPSGNQNAKGAGKVRRYNPATDSFE